MAKLYKNEYQLNNMNKFNYILDKINNTEFSTKPFKCLYIQDLLSPEHFNLIQRCPQIKCPIMDDTKSLIDYLKNNHYKIQHFPGCVNNENQYLNWLNNKSGTVRNNDIVEGFGMAFSLSKIESSEILDLMNFLNSSQFHQCLHNKFNITENSVITTRIQKYLTGYEISPHPDTRTKCLTYLININTDPAAEDIDIHTHLLKFKKEYEYVYNYWSNNPNKDRCWVPWDWCDSEFIVKQNNSLIMFQPSNDTLHAVKLDYDHLQFQRTQIYGNLWYSNVKKYIPETYKDIRK